MPNGGINPKRGGRVAGGAACSGPHPNNGSTWIPSSIDSVRIVRRVESAGDPNCGEAIPSGTLAGADNRGCMWLKASTPEEQYIKVYSAKCPIYVRLVVNCQVCQKGLLRLVVWRLTSLKNGERPKQLTLDIDGLPIEVHGHQGGSAYHGLYGTRIYSPLIASLAETSDMVGGLLREGNAGPAENADTWIPHLVKRLNESTGAQVRVRIPCVST